MKRPALALAVLGALALAALLAVMATRVVLPVCPAEDEIPLVGAAGPACVHVDNVAPDARRMVGWGR